jgi:hypothetical protein
MSDQPTDLIEEPQGQGDVEDDTEGQSLAAAVAVSGFLGSRPREPQWAREDALPLDEPKGRHRKATDAGGGSARKSTTP